MINQLTTQKQISGLSLIELLVSVTIGSLLLLGLVSSFQTSSNSQRELEKAGQMIENGRYAIGLIGDDLRHAGFFDYFYDLGTWAPTTTLPDPCELGTAADLEAAMAMPIQGYRAANLSTRPDVSGTNSCETNHFTSANLQAGSDILVIRRAETAVFTGNPTANEV
ncbi:MAG: type IV pilus assembly protein PilW, partial [Gammaproteobacteria bacterium]